MEVNTLTGVLLILSVGFHGTECEDRKFLSNVIPLLDDPTAEQNPSYIQYDPTDEKNPSYIQYDPTAEENPSYIQYDPTAEENPSYIQYDSTHDYVMPSYDYQSAEKHDRQKRYVYNTNDFYASLYGAKRRRKPYYWPSANDMLTWYHNGRFKRSKEQENRASKSLTALREPLGTEVSNTDTKPTRKQLPEVQRRQMEGIRNKHRRNNKKETKLVTLDLYPTMIEKLEDDKLTMTAWLQMKWSDRDLARIAYGRQYGKRRMPDEFYLSLRSVDIPDVYLYNNAATGPVKYQVDDLVSVTTEEGEFMFIAPLKLSAYCPGADKKIENGTLADCPLKFGPWIHDISDLDVEVGQNGLSLAELYPNERIQVDRTSAEKGEADYACCPGKKYAHVTFWLYLKKE